MDINPLANFAEPIALVVADEPLILMDTSEIIRDAAYWVVEAASADEAFAFLRKHNSLQLHFTDIQTGGRLDGLELSRRVADRWPTSKSSSRPGRGCPPRRSFPRIQASSLLWRLSSTCYVNTSRTGVIRGR
jgi:CheY-like chemotaxis protein